MSTPDPASTDWVPLAGLPGPAGPQGPKGDPGPAGSGPRIVRGAISGAGAILNGTGFTVSRAGVGQYTITFTTPFSSIPVVVATPGPYYAFVNISAGPFTGSVSFTTVSNSFNFVDSPIYFMAMDP